MIIDEYIGVLQEIDDILEEIEAVKAQIDEIGLKKKQLVTSRTQLMQQKDGECKKERSRVIDEAVKEKTRPYNEQMAEANRLLSEKEAEISGKISEIEAKNYNLLFEEEFNIINDCLAMIRAVRGQVNDLFDYSVAERIQGSVSNQHTTIEAIIELRRLVDEKLSAVSLAQQKSLLERFLGKVFPDPDKISQHPASLQILKFAITIIMVSFFLFRIPAVLVLVYSGFIGLGVLRDVRNTRQLLEAYYPYKYLEFHCIKLRDLLEREAANRKAKDLQDLKDELQQFEMDTQCRIDDLQEIISNIPADVVASLNEEEVQKRVEAMYADRLNTITVNIGKQDSRLKTKQGEFSTLQAELLDLQDQKKQLKEELVKAVMTLESLGSSKLLLKTFFLGFGDDDRLITMDYKGDTTLVIYSGGDSNCVISFIRMMIIQFFTNMLVNNLFIDIIDVENSGTAYDIFRYQSLRDVISIATTQDETTDLINRLHKEMRQRSEKISAIADNIDRFNEIMIQRDSFTLEYRIIVFNTCDLDVIRNLKFMQICKNGPANGIIPIVFYNIMDMPNLEKSTNTDSSQGSMAQVYKAWYEFFKSVSQFFNFNSDTSEVTSLGSGFKTSFMEKLTELM